MMVGEAGRHCWPGVYVSNMPEFPVSYFGQSTITIVGVTVYRCMGDEEAVLEEAFEKNTVLIDGTECVKFEIEYWNEEDLRPELNYSLNHTYGSEYSDRLVVAGTGFSFRLRRMLGLRRMMWRLCILRLV